MRVNRFLTMVSVVTILIVFCSVVVSCMHLRGYRKAKIIDNNGNPLEGVYLTPAPLFGIGLKVSNNDGIIAIPKEMPFYLAKTGYKTLYIKSDDGRSTFIFVPETRSLEERHNDWRIWMSETTRKWNPETGEHEKLPPDAWPSLSE